MGECEALEEFPFGVCKLVALEKLYFGVWKFLTKIPEGLGGSTSLKEFYNVGMQRPWKNFHPEYALSWH